MHHPRARNFMAGVYRGDLVRLELEFSFLGFL